MTERAFVQEAPSVSSVRFEAQIHEVGGWAIVTLPEDASARLPSRGQVAVDGAINGHRFQAVLEPDGRRGHWLKLDKGLHDALGAREGKTVSLEVEPTREWPEPNIPKDFRTALADAPDISELWGDITSMARWEWVRWVKATKNPATRARRVEVAISKLRSGKRRPCCFDLSACTDPDLSRNGKLAEQVVNRGRAVDRDA